MNSRKHAVFTSCGDRSKCFELWSGKNRKYDLICSYYGNNDGYLNHPLTNVQGTAGQFDEFSSIVYRAVLR